MIIRAKIDVTKIDKSKIFVGAKGKYIDITLLENRDGPDQFDNDFMVVQDIGKEARERGEKGPILGNAKFLGDRTSNAAQSPKADNQGRYSTRSNEAPRPPDRQPPTTTMKQDVLPPEDVPW